MARWSRFCDTEVPNIQATPGIRVGDYRAVSTIYQNAKWTGYGEDDIRRLLREEKKRCPIYSKAWAEAEHKCERRRSWRGMAEGHVAVTCYSLGSDFYSTFNNKSRDMVDGNDWKSFPYKSMWALLARILNDYDSVPSVYTGRPVTLYRGATKEVDLVPLRRDEHDLFTFKQYTSTSTSMDRAMGFTKGGQSGSLMVFQGTPLAGRGIKEHSVFPEEEEVLLCPWSTFAFLGTEPMRGTNITKVYFQAEGPFAPGFPYNKEMTQVQQQNYIGSNVVQAVKGWFQ